MVKHEVGNRKDVTWVEKYQWYALGNHLWICVDTEYYHYSDEASQIDIFGYETREDCQEAMDLYVVELKKLT